MKRIRFIGSSRDDLSAFPRSVRARIGQDLFMVQVGRDPDDWKPLTVVGAGVREIRVRDDAGAFRVIYVAKLENAIYVLHAFQKKSQKTSRMHLELAMQRYRIARALEQGSEQG